MQRMQKEGQTRPSEMLRTTPASRMDTGLMDSEYRYLREFLEIRAKLHVHAPQTCYLVSTFDSPPTTTPLGLIRVSGAAGSYAARSCGEPGHQH
jgi:hypothetical protein